MEYKHILFCTDLSENSRKAGLQACQLAQESGATLDIIHVIEHLPTAYGGEFSIPIDLNLEQAIEAAARKKLAEEGEALNISPEKQHLLTGAVKHNVLEKAEELQIDLIIVGTHSHHGLEVLLGSRANAILHSAKCDVLAVRAQT